MRTIGAGDQGEPGLLLTVEPGVSLEKDPPRLLDRLAILGQPLECADLGAADLVDGGVGELHDMERVEDDRGLGKALADLGDEGLRHVHGNQPDQVASLGAEGVEEGVEGLARLALTAPDDLAAGVVGDDGEVLVMLAVGDLVDADRVEAAAVERDAPPLDGTLDDVANGAPGDLHDAADDGAVGVLSEEADDVLEVAAEDGVRLRPRHDLGDDGVAARAAEAPGSGAEVDLPRAEIDVPPHPPAGVIGADRGSSPAARALEASAPRFDIDDDGLRVRVKRDLRHGTCLQGEQTTEYRGQLHRGRFLRRG